MAAPTLKDLLATQTADEALATLLQRLSGQSFPVTAWQSGGAARTLLQLFAEGLADAGALLVEIAKGGFAALATGDWLTLVASQVYGLDRNEATFTQGTCVLTCAATAPGYTITAGQLTAISSTGLRYSNVNGGNLAAGNTLSLTFQAEQAGSAYNAGVGDITVLGTPLPGVTINNPDAGGGTWITSSGTDEETDASLLARCQARWPSLSAVPTSPVFDLWAKAADITVTKTLSQVDVATPGQVDLYLAGAAGEVAAAVVSAVQSYVDARMPLTSTCVVASAVNAPVQVDAHLYVKSGYEGTAPAAAQAAVEAYILGTDIDGTVYESEVDAALQDQDGVRNVTIDVLALQSVGAGVGDVDISAVAGGPHVATPVVTITTVVV